MYYPQTLLPTPNSHYSQPPRAQPRIQPQFNPDSSPLKPNPYTHGLYGLQPKFIPSTQSVSELPTPYISQQQKTALQTLSKNIGPDYVFPTLPKSPLRAKFNPLSDPVLTEQVSPLRKKLTLDFNSNTRTKTLPSLDNDYNEPLYSRSPVNQYPDLGYPRGQELLVPKNRGKTIAGFDYLKFGASRSERQLDDVEISPRLENNKPFYIPQKTESEKKVNSGSPASFERSLTLDTEDYIITKDNNRLAVGYSPYAEMLNKSPQSAQQPTPKRRPAGPVSLTSLVQSPSAPLVGNNDMYYLKASLGINAKNTNTGENKVEDEPSIHKNLQGTNRDQEGVSPRTVVKLERKYRKATTMANLKPVRTEPDEDDEDVNDVSVENNMKRESEKIIQNMRVKKLQENQHMKKLSEQKEKESQPEQYESPKKEFVIKDSKKNLKQLFRQATMEGKESDSVKKSGMSEGIGQKMSPRSPRDKLESIPEKQEKPEKQSKPARQKMAKMDIKIMGENGIKTKEIKMFPGDLSEILEKNFNANESDEEDSEPIHYDLGLVNLLAGLDAEDSNHSPRVARAKLTKVVKNKK